MNCQLLLKDKRGIQGCVSLKLKLNFFQGCFKILMHAQTLKQMQNEINRSIYVHHDQLLAGNGSVTIGISCECIPKTNKTSKCII